MKIISYPVLLLTSLAVSPVHASCEYILKYVNYDRSLSYSNLNREQVTLATYCSERYDSSNVQQAGRIEASYKVFTGNASASSSNIQEHQEKTCNGKFGADYLSSITRANEERIGDNIKEMIAQCEASRRDSFELSSLSWTKGGFSASVRWRGGGEIFFNGIRIVSEGISNQVAANCTVDYKEQRNITTPFNIEPNVPVLISCNRIPQEEKRENINSIYYPEALVSIQSDRGVVPVLMYSIMQYRDPEARIASVEKNYDALAKEIINLKAEAERSQKKVGELQSRITVVEKRKYSISLGNAEQKGPWLPQKGNRISTCGGGEIFAGLIWGVSDDTRVYCQSISIRQE